MSHVGNLTLAVGMTLAGSPALGQETPTTLQSDMEMRSGAISSVVFLEQNRIPRDFPRVMGAKDETPDEKILRRVTRTQNQIFSLFSGNIVWGNSRGLLTKVDYIGLSLCEGLYGSSRIKFIISGTHHRINGSLGFPGTGKSYSSTHVTLLIGLR